MNALKTIKYCSAGLLIACSQSVLAQTQGSAVVISAEDTLKFIENGFLGCNGKFFRRSGSVFNITGWSVYYSRESIDSYRFDLSDVGSATWTPHSYWSINCRSGGCVTYTNQKSGETERSNEFRLASCGSEMTERLMKAINYYAANYGKKTPF